MSSTWSLRFMEHVMSSVSSIAALISASISSFASFCRSYKCYMFLNLGNSLITGIISWMNWLRFCLSVILGFFYVPFVARFFWIPLLSMTLSCPIFIRKLSKRVYTWKQFSQTMAELKASLYPFKSGISWSHGKCIIFSREISMSPRWPLDLKRCRICWPIIMYFFLTSTY